MLYYALKSKMKQVDSNQELMDTIIPEQISHSVAQKIMTGAKYPRGLSYGHSWSSNTETFSLTHATCFASVRKMRDTSSYNRNDKE